MSATLQHKDYTVGWICALPAELSAARAMLDEIHESLSQPPTDHNAYTLGRVGKHNIVLAGLPLGGTGTNSAAIVADQMMHSFTIRFGLMVGIGGGAPSSDCDLRLGDVVVSKPGLDDGGVVQYDFGKTLPGGFRRTHTLNKPPTVLLTALTKLMSEHDHNGNKIAQYLEGINKMKTPSNYKHPGPKYDQLYVSYYDHVDPDPKSSCDKCDSSKLVHRADRGSSNDVQVFYGTIASGNRVMRSGVERDRLRKELGVLCFEMEAAGLMDNFPCVVIRGICDYADSHKDKRWQGYAAATAAACAKELLSIMPTEHVNDSPVTEPTL
ncbi:nucleoside phosphorylase domain-containing protein, partial [Leptodontidium sp. MPI-SDFR-AT-0119]